jgi:hypothetical protein
VEQVQLYVVLPVVVMACSEMPPGQRIEWRLALCFGLGDDGTEREE